VISEKMLLVSPTLAATLGLEEALLFQLLYEARALQDLETINISITQQKKMFPFWSDMQFLAVSNRLQAQGVISIISQSPWQFKIDPLFDTEGVKNKPDKIPVAEQQNQGSAFEPTPTAGTQIAETAPQQAIHVSPAIETETLPVFSMNEARRRNQQDDDLAYLKPSQSNGGRVTIQRVRMQPDWEPSEQFPNLLSFHNIPLPFALSELEKFRQYYLASERQEANWDIRLVNWVQRAWHDSSHSKGRYEQSNHTTREPENNPREKRARVRDALRNISDTDW
jgi:hypothetical protein